MPPLAALAPDTAPLTVSPLVPGSRGATLLRALWQPDARIRIEYTDPDSFELLRLLIAHLHQRGRFSVLLWTTTVGDLMDQAITAIGMAEQLTVEFPHRLRDGSIDTDDWQARLGVDQSMHELDIRFCRSWISVKTFNVACGFDNDGNGRCAGPCRKHGPSVPLDVILAAEPA